MPMWKYENKHSLWQVLALFHFYDDNANEDDDDDDDDHDDDDDDNAGASLVCTADPLTCSSQ